MPHRTTVRILVFDASERLSWKEFAGICKQHHGSYANFSFPGSAAKRLGYIFRTDEDLDAAYEDVVHRESCAANEVSVK